jgi:hypothetical protein
VSIHQSEAKSRVYPGTGRISLPAIVVAQRSVLSRPHDQVLHIPPRQVRAATSGFKIVVNKEDRCGEISGFHTGVIVFILMGCDVA